MIDIVQPNWKGPEPLFFVTASIGKICVTCFDPDGSTKATGTYERTAGILPVLEER